METEVEFKLIVAASRLPAIRAALRSASARGMRLQARYFDTPDEALAAHGIVLRLRKEGRRWVQTIKARGVGPLERFEHNVDLKAPRALACASPPERVQENLGRPGVSLRAAHGGEPQPNPARHAGTPSGNLLEQVLANTGTGLVQTYATDVRRLAALVRHGASEIEVALDTGAITAPLRSDAEPRRAEVRELEMELRSGSVQDLTALARRWCADHGLWFSSVSKSERGRRLIRGDVPPPAVKASAPRLGSTAAKWQGPDIQRAVVNACLAQILPNASEVAGGSDDAEHIHQLRVGLRRLRTALRELRALGPGLDAAWDAPLAQVFRALGARRDTQQMLALVSPRLEAAGAPPLASLDRDATAEPPDTAVRSPAFQDTLIALIGFAATPQDDPAPASGAGAHAARTHIQRRLSKLRRQVLSEGRRFDELDDEQQHRVRKRLKRLRYLAEFIAPGFPGRATQRFLKALEPVQDALGSHCDALAARDHFRARAGTEAHAWFAVGWLSAWLARSGRRCRASLRELGEPRTFWKSPH